jgi:putative intracellular protease/amidase
LAEQVRRLAHGDQSAEAVEALVELRRARARAEGGPATTRCQAALALAMTLAIAGRADEALLEALDALARAREAQDPKAVGACMALLAKLYSSAGHPGEAAALRESSGAG